jgi:hypothetical protein
VTEAASIFRVSAFAALILLVVHSIRSEGVRTTALLFGYLLAMSIFREGNISFFVHVFGLEAPYQPDANMGHLWFVNAVVLAGWVFTTYISFLMAKMIQRRHFPGTNLFLTLALTALVTTTISYPVEITGIRLHFWEWAEWATSDPMRWIPFGWPFDAYQGWANTSFMFMFVYCGIRYRMFSAAKRRNMFITIGLFLFWVYSFLLPLPKLYYDQPTWLFFVYVAVATYLGFARPRLPLRLRSPAAAEVPARG